MKKILTFLAIGSLALAGCGDSDDDKAAAPKPAGKPEATPEKKEGEVVEAGTAITVGASEFGEMLFDANRQAIYIFENDRRAKSACYGDCAEAWPPVLTKGEPRAGDGVDSALLGTTRRNDGATQVTYAGQPLYFYAHEERGEVKCHNVHLNGGFWWVVGPDGNRRP